MNGDKKRGRRARPPAQPKFYELQNKPSTEDVIERVRAVSLTSTQYSSCNTWYRTSRRPFALLYNMQEPTDGSSAACHRRQVLSCVAEVSDTPLSLLQPMLMYDDDGAASSTVHPSTILEEHLPPITYWAIVPCATAHCVVPGRCICNFHPLDWSSTITSLANAVDD